MATEKQKAVARKIVETHGSVSGAMRSVGYKDKTAKNPKNLTESKGWAELMDQYYPDDKIAKIQQKMLKASILRTMEFDYSLDERSIRKIVKSSGGKVSHIQVFEPGGGKGKKKFSGSKRVYFTIPDQRIVDSTMDKILKSKGRYISKIEVDNKRKYGAFTDAELDRIIAGEDLE